MSAALATTLHTFPGCPLSTQSGLQERLALGASGVYAGKMKQQSRMLQIKELFVLSRRALQAYLLKFLTICRTFPLFSQFNSHPRVIPKLSAKRSTHSADRLGVKDCKISISAP